MDERWRHYEPTGLGQQARCMMGVLAANTWTSKRPVLHPENEWHESALMALPHADGLLAIPRVWQLRRLPTRIGHSGQRDAHARALQARERIASARPITLSTGAGPQRMLH